MERLVREERYGSMSYNITAINILEGSLSIRKEDLLTHKPKRENIPEINLFEEAEQNEDEIYTLTNKIPWCGQFSGESYQFYLLPILMYFNGIAHIQVIWEGGDCIQLLTVDNGKIWKTKDWTVGKQKIESDRQNSNSLRDTLEREYHDYILGSLFLKEK